MILYKMNRKMKKMKIFMDEHKNKTTISIRMNRPDFFSIE